MSNVERTLPVRGGETDALEWRARDKDAARVERIIAKRDAAGRERGSERNYQRSMTEFPAVFSVRPAAFTVR